MHPARGNGPILSETWRARRFAAAGRGRRMARGQGARVMQRRLFGSFVLMLLAACGQQSAQAPAAPEPAANAPAETQAPAATEAPAPPDEPPPIELVGTSWVALEIDGQPAADGQSTLEFIAIDRAAGR